MFSVVALLASLPATETAGGAESPEFSWADDRWVGKTKIASTSKGDTNTGFNGSPLP
jgi:hypothetical protein